MGTTADSRCLLGSVEVLFFNETFQCFRNPFCHRLIFYINNTSRKNMPLSTKELSRFALLTLGLAFRSVVSAVAASDTASGAAQKFPNIIVLMTDEQRLSAIGAYGATPCKTPNLDKLARAGVRFETCYTTAPLCTPARASFITGLYPHAHGMATNEGEPGCAFDELPDSPMLLPRRLAKLGYTCGFTGKWHLGVGKKSPTGEPGSLPSTRGFVGQDFPGHGSGGWGYPQFKKYLADHGLSFKILPHPTDGVKVTGYGVIDGPPEAGVPHFLADHTISLIDRFCDEGKPFFIWHNEWGPHGEHYVPRKYYEMYRNVAIPPWPNYVWPGADLPGPWQVMLHPNRKELKWDDWMEALRFYYAMATEIDEEFGRILEHLEKKGIAKNTVIIFTSDHGETLGSHGGLINKGWTHFEEMQRIGLIISDPREGSPMHRPGKVVGSLSSLLDIYPTILDLAGDSAPAVKVHGRSLLPLVANPEVPWRDSVVVEFHGLSGISATMLTIRHGQIKYGWTGGGRDELYDLAKDPYEMSNLIDNPDHSETLREMRLRLYAFMTESKHPAANIYRQSVLKYTVDRQFLHRPDPEPLDRFSIKTAW